MHMRTENARARTRPSRPMAEREAPSKALHRLGGAPPQALLLFGGATPQALPPQGGATPATNAISGSGRWAMSADGGLGPLADDSLWLYSLRETRWLRLHSPPGGAQPAARLGHAALASSPSTLWLYGGLVGDQQQEHYVNDQQPVGL